MKKTGIVMALCVLFSVSKAQPGPYGQLTYQHSIPCELNSGMLLTWNTGLLMGGNNITVTSPGQFNFYVDKTDFDGNYNNLGTTDFSEEYIVSTKPPGCTGVAAPITNCYGVSAIENNPNLSGGALTSTVKYLVAGTTDDGIFYVGINASGTAVQSANYKFPNSGTAGQKKPKIVQFSTGGGNVGHYYICGYFTVGTTERMYLIKINDSGAIVGGGSYAYTIGGAGTYLEPNDMIESPYAPGYLVIVGTYYLSGDTEAFLMEFDDASVSVSNFIDYDNGGANDSFNSINIKSSTAVPTALPGFIIGGATDANSGSANPGVCMIQYVDYTYASNGCWAITPTNDNQGGKLVAVLERPNLTNVYENYGLCTTQNGMTVVKIDDAGGAWGTPPNEFVYNTSQKSVASNITDFNTPGGPNLGIQVFGTYYTGGAAVDGYLVQACFNGNTGCTSSETLISLQSVSALTPTPPANPTSAAAALTACTGAVITQSSGPAINNQICAQTLSGLPTGGSNARSAALTSIKKITTTNDQISIFPNPAKDLVTIHFPKLTIDAVKLEIENNLGEVAVSILISKKDLNSTNDYRMDIGKMNLENGIYFAKISTDGKTKTEKLIIAK